MSDEKYLAKIAKLLRQAERAATEAEAEAFMTKAQQLASATQISLAVARAHQDKQERRAVPVQKSLVVGPRGKRGLKQYVKLGLAIAAANDVTCDIAQDSTVLYLYGFEADIEVVEALFASLLFQMVQAADRYLRSGAYKAETRWVDQYERDCWGYRNYVGRVQKPMHGAVARTSFMDAFAWRIGARLREARAEAVAEAKAVEVVEQDIPQISSGTELALVEKAVEIRDFYKATSDARGSWRGFRSSGSGRSAHATDAGHRAASRARLGGERAIASAR